MSRVAAVSVSPVLDVRHRFTLWIVRQPNSVLQYSSRCACIQLCLILNHNVLPFPLRLRSCQARALWLLGVCGQNLDPQHWCNAYQLVVQHMASKDLVVSGSYCPITVME